MSQLRGVDFSQRSRIAILLPDLLRKEWSGFPGENSPWGQMIRPTWMMWG